MTSCSVSSFKMHLTTLHTSHDKTTAPPTRRKEAWLFWKHCSNDSKTMRSSSGAWEPSSATNIPSNSSVLRSAEEQRRARTDWTSMSFKPSRQRRETHRRRDGRWWVHKEPREHVKQCRPRALWGARDCLMTTLRTRGSSVQRNPKSSRRQDRLQISFTAKNSWSPKTPRRRLAQACWRNQTFSNNQVLTTTKGAQTDRQTPSEKVSPHVSYGLKSPVRACPRTFKTRGLRVPLTKPRQLVKWPSGTEDHCWREDARLPAEWREREKPQLSLTKKKNCAVQNYCCDFLQDKPCWGKKPLRHPSVNACEGPFKKFELVIAPLRNLRGRRAASGRRPHCREKLKAAHHIESLALHGSSSRACRALVTARTPALTNARLHHRTQPHQTCTGRLKLFAIAGWWIPVQRPCWNHRWAPPRRAWDTSHGTRGAEQYRRTSASRTHCLCARPRK